ncbi:MAG TPA: NrfD/PsrC family molybdoenzyme membrane anchor subunit [Stellaceae bacterium]|nr:NrfD/PsrC family molybdoenzyme membrane anchor subunit [Stellaceae bacterium]
MSDAPQEQGYAPMLSPGLTLASVSTQVSDIVLKPGAPRWWWVGFGISFALFVLLVIAVCWLFINGIGIWGVEIPVAWGLAIAEYVWWIALASGGTIVSALFYLTRSEWRSATNRIAETMMLCAAASAGVMPILHLGRPGLFYWIFAYPNVMGIWPQFRSPLLWDFVCVICYIIMSIFFYYLGALPDLATVRDRARTRTKQIFYGVLALGWRGSARHWAIYKSAYSITAAIMAPMVISVHSVVGLDFAGGLTPGWHSTQFPPYFFFGAVVSGLALVIMLTVLVRWGYGLHDIITERHLNILGKVMLTGSLMLSYSYAWEAWGPFYGSDVAERTMFLERVFGLYAGTFWAKTILNAFIPQLLWIPWVRRRPVPLFLISTGIIVGMWLERFVIVITSLHRNYTPAMWGNFFPTFWDWATLAGSIGLFLTLFFLILRIMPIVSLAEMRELIHREKGA